MPFNPVKPFSFVFYLQINSAPRKQKRERNSKEERLSEREPKSSKERALLVMPRTNPRHTAPSSHASHSADPSLVLVLTDPPSSTYPSFEPTHHLHWPIPRSNQPITFKLSFTDWKPDTREERERERERERELEGKMNLKREREIEPGRISSLSSAHSRCLKLVITTKHRLVPRHLLLWVDLVADLLSLFVLWFCCCCCCCCGGGGGGMGADVWVVVDFVIKKKLFGSWENDWENVKNL